MSHRPPAATSALLRALSPALLTMTEDLTGTMFCAKDVEGHYVLVNDAFVRRTNERSRRAVVGRTADQLFEPMLAARYDEQDREVLEQGRELRRELELIRRPGGTPGWYLTSKAPVRAEDGTVVGLVSISQALRGQDADPETVASLTRVATLVRERIAHPPTVAELAAAAGCSPATLDRRLRRVFALSPQQYVLRARVDHAAALLGGSTLPVAEVARAAGFYDQASFTRTFGRLTGETPAQFRRAARDAGDGQPATGGLPWPSPPDRDTMGA
ncbi:AraC family transcriptional regulator [Cellulomonas denverensis]|uniref:AraC family transcriptional regulator n=1 Tax=Cellulomonas denverensis TaxID=264297 RepID=A0A7X6QYX6_9CELL|nr:AraC family transcriptional regulator [Cellulomonas denverensis]NKY22481.1 AraC family transcriptional regulator [Cellulomonas denverensis]GIG25954.1 transcriptional regulator [Cellulomonas denverensis]